MLGFQCLKGFFGIKNCYILSTAAFDNGILASSVCYSTNITCFVKRDHVKSISCCIHDLLVVLHAYGLAFSIGFWTGVI